MLALICAAGSQTRWNESGGKGLKQFVTVNGEPVVTRLHRLATDHPATTRVVTVVQDPTDPTWNGLSPVGASPERWMGEMGKFLDHREHWPTTGELCVLYGDAYYTEGALDAILTHKPDRPTVYGRAHGQGRRLESFGFRFTVEQAPYVEKVARECAAHGMNRKGGPWRWFHRSHHRDLDSYSAKRVKALVADGAEGWVELAPDATEDFDRASDLVQWRRVWRMPA